MNAKDITRAVVRFYYPPRRWAVCPNVSWGCLSWEADVLAVTPAGTVHEIEVKISKSDLLRDKSKRKWGFRAPADNPWPDIDGLAPVRRLIDSYWLAVPQHLEDDAMTRASEIGAGVYVVDADGIARIKRQCSWKRRDADLRAKYSTSQEDIWRLCSMRFWDVFQKQVLQ